MAGGLVDRQEHIGMCPPSPLIAVQLCACTHKFDPVLNPACNLKWGDHLALWEEPLHVLAVNRSEKENDTDI